MSGVNFADLLIFIYAYSIDKKGCVTIGDLKNKKDEVVGKVKESIGDMTGNDKLKLKGKAQKTSGKAKDKVADAKEKAAEKTNEVLDD